MVMVLLLKAKCIFPCLEAMLLLEVLTPEHVKSHYPPFPPGAHMDCRSFVGHGCLGLLIVALSSLHKEMRLAAGHALSRFEAHLEESKFREKPQVCSL